MSLRFICFVCFLSAVACSSRSPRTDLGSGTASDKTPITQEAKRQVGDVIIVEMDKEALSMIESKIQKLFSEQKSDNKNSSQIKLNLAEKSKASLREPASVKATRGAKTSVVIDLAGIATMPFRVREVLADGSMHLESTHPLRVARKLCEVTVTADLTQDILGAKNVVQSSSLKVPQYNVVFDSISTKK